MTIEQHYDDVLTINSCALQQGMTMLQIIKLLHPEWEIDSITGRLKSKESLIAKTTKKKIFEFKEEESEAYYDEIRDEVAFRIIVRNPAVVPLLFETIKACAGYLYKKKVDYLENKKANGYRSLHMYGDLIIGGIGLGSNKLVRNEIQIRTLPQHNWASVEHGTRYKLKYESINAEVDAIIVAIAELCGIESYKDDESIAALAHILNAGDIEAKEMISHLNNLLLSEDKDYMRKECPKLLAGILEIRNNNYNELAEIGVQMDRVTAKIYANTDEKAMVLDSLRKLEIAVGPDKIVPERQSANSNAESVGLAKDRTTLKAVEDGIKNLSVKVSESTTT